MEHTKLTNHFRPFLMAGNSTFTVKNIKTGNRYTYKIKQAKDQNDKPTDTYFVSFLNGPDNWSNYAYIGIIRDNQYAWTSKARAGQESQVVKGFQWVFNHIETLPEHVEIWHAGKCARCAKKLTVPESIESGFGPECIKHVGI